MSIESNQNPNLHQGFFFLGSSSSDFCLLRKTLRFASSSRAAMSAGAATATSRMIRSPSTSPSADAPRPLSSAAISSGVIRPLPLPPSTLSRCSRASWASALSCARGSPPSAASPSPRPTAFMEYVKTEATNPKSTDASTTLGTISVEPVFLGSLLGLAAEEDALDGGLDDGGADDEESDRWVVPAWTRATVQFVAGRRARRPAVAFWNVERFLCGGPRRRFFAIVRCLVVDEIIARRVAVEIETIINYCLLFCCRFFRERSRFRTQRRMLLYDGNRTNAFRVSSPKQAQ
mmetsp:Transcript_14566/g.40473  ORF Transcript_14566/g.40473 Transcript_14566/m.40473 type:complete len:290 (+) Transcript_14566:388-1257(+)